MLEAPTTWMLSGSSPKFRMRVAASCDAGKCTCDSLVIAWRIDSSMEPVTSPPSTCATAMFI